MSGTAILIGAIIIIAIIGAVVALSFGGSDGGSSSNTEVHIAGNFKLTFEDSFNSTEKNYIIDGATKLSNVITDTNQIPVIIKKYQSSGDDIAKANKNSGDIFRGGTVQYNTNKFPGDNCDWAGITMHEFLHVLGFTNSYTGWSNKVVSGLSLQPFTCARFYYTCVGVTNPGLVYTNIPLEPGSTSHWNESVFGPEIMTPKVVGSCQSDQLQFSKMTAGALKDLGFQIDINSSTISAGYFLPS